MRTVAWQLAWYPLVPRPCWLVVFPATEVKSKVPFISRSERFFPTVKMKVATSPAKERIVIILMAVNTYGLIVCQVLI